MRNPWLVCASLAVCCLSFSSSGQSETAEQFVEASGIQGGVIAYVGDPSAGLLVELGRNGRCLIHGLIEEGSAGFDRVMKMRKTIQERGMSGKVMLDVLNGNRLPYSDNLVNLILWDRDAGLSGDEVMRVLSPRGVAIVKDNDGRRTRELMEAGLQDSDAGSRLPGGWVKLTKPVPAEIDEWSHYLHGADNNPVAIDSVVGPPRRLQWTATPLRCRSHEHISSFCAMVSAGGRVFYVMDEGLTGIHNPLLRDHWTLTARDAFNGVLLWKMPLPEWRAKEWRNTTLRGRPRSVPRRLVAGETVLYITLGEKAPVSMVNPATGECLKTVEGTQGARCLLLSGDTLIVSAKKPSETQGGSLNCLMGVDSDSGEIRWETPCGKTFDGLSFAANNARVVYYCDRETTCLDLTTGRRIWNVGDSAQKIVTKRGRAARTSGSRSLVLYKNVLLEQSKDLLARDLNNGEVLWTLKTGGRSMRSSDFFVIDDLVWAADGTGISGYDVKSGERVKTVDPSGVQSWGHHLRCYRSKATNRFLITQCRGAEFISVKDENHAQNDWVRGACSYGVMPANGMFYAPPTPCTCYPGSIMTGLNAFSTASDEALNAIVSIPSPARLEKGSAFPGVIEGGEDLPADDWPMYRHDERRTGSTRCEVSARISKKWEVDLGGGITPPVSAGGRVYLSIKDQHVVCALDAENGNRIWSHIAGARVDSSPTLYRGRVLFGCADGWVYCLRAKDGKLAWRFRAAPQVRLMIDDNRIESAWRVHGSLVVCDDVLYCMAGRSSFLDGGLFLYGLNPQTGEVLHEARLHTTMNKRDDAVGKPFITPFSIEGGSSDLLVAEQGFIFFGQFKYTSDLKKVESPYVPHSDNETTVGLDISKADYVDTASFSGGFDKTMNSSIDRGHMGDRRVGLHLISTGGFLDDSWFNRTFWMYSETWPGYHWGRFAPKAGHLLVVGEEKTYAVQAYPSRRKNSPQFSAGKRGYLLIVDRNDNEPIMDSRAWKKDKGFGYTRKAPPEWHRWIPIRMRSMVLSGHNLFVAGPPDVLDPRDPEAAFEGRKGSLLRVIDSANGDQLAEYELESEPVFDGMAVARGKLFVGFKNGSITCFSNK